MSARRGEGWSGELTCDACPVQIEGEVDGLPFYFRARYQTVTFSVAEQPGDDPIDVCVGAGRGFHAAFDVGGDDPFAAGYLPPDIAWWMLGCFIIALRLERARALPGRCG